jgi:hypothetical protein
MTSWESELTEFLGTRFLAFACNTTEEVMARRLRGEAEMDVEQERVLAWIFETTGRLVDGMRKQGVPETMRPTSSSSTSPNSGQIEQ